MRINIRKSVLTLFSGVCLTASAMSDREVVDALYAVSKGGCDYDNVMLAYNRVIAECRGDRERLSRLIVRLAQERKECTKWSLRALAAHGTPQSLPFICGFTNDLSCAISFSSVSGANIMSESNHMI